MPTPSCEADCERLAVSDPAALVAAFPAMRPTLLTFAAEYLGRAPADVAVPALLPLLDHPKAYVREGALYGLMQCDDPRAVAAILRAAEHDPSEAVRTIAREWRDYEPPAMPDPPPRGPSVTLKL